jgi:hypothetical protein
MTPGFRRFVAACLPLIALFWLIGRGAVADQQPYYPPAGTTFGKLLGSIPTERAATNGLIIRHGYIVGEFGDTLRPDPTYSVARS